MAATRTPGITVDTGGLRTINKEHRGERIFARLGLVGQEQAERRLAKELERLDWELERRAHARPYSPTAPNDSCSNPSTNGVRPISRGIWECYRVMSAIS